MAKYISLCSHEEVLDGKLHVMCSANSDSAKQTIEVCFSRKCEKKIHPLLKIYNNKRQQKPKKV